MSVEGSFRWYIGEQMYRLKGTGYLQFLGKFKRYRFRFVGHAVNADSTRGDFVSGYFELPTLAKWLFYSYDDVRSGAAIIRIHFPGSETVTKMQLACVKASTDDWIAARNMLACFKKIDQDRQQAMGLHVQMQQTTEEEEEGIAPAYAAP